jgi:hypothetical protein
MSAVLMRTSLVPPDQVDNFQEGVKKGRDLALGTLRAVGKTAPPRENGDQLSTSRAVRSHGLCPPSPRHARKHAILPYQRVKERGPDMEKDGREEQKCENRVGAAQEGIKLVVVRHNLRQMDWYRERSDSHQPKALTNRPGAWRSARRREGSGKP